MSKTKLKYLSVAYPLKLKDSLHSSRLYTPDITLKTIPSSEFLRNINFSI